jgi:hypothetical protein
MPAISKKQRRAMAIAEHHPEQLFAKNKGLLQMSKGQLHDYASTPEKSLPVRKRPSARAKSKLHKRLTSWK